MKQPSVHYPLKACYDSIVDELQIIALVSQVFSCE
jgi:hypothetical protein